MTNKFNRGTATLLMIGTIFLSGISGFTGAYLSNNFKTETTSSIATTLSTSSTLSNIALTSTNKNSGESLSVAGIASHALDSVVEITTETVSTGARMKQYVSEGAGSGVIISKDGYIVTNHHVIDGASKISVKTTDKKSYTATLIGKDAKTDIAVIKIKADNLQPAVYGDSSSLVVGELAVAIGNPLGELGGTVTEGIISALNRDIVIDGETMNLLQTSAAINPGNSGGGLFNEHGELIGIVNAKSSGSGIEGLGFAIPINTAIQVINDIIDFGYVQGRIDTGLKLLDISDAQTARIYRVQTTGLYIQQVSDNSSEFKAGDRIISVEGIQVNNFAKFKEIIDKHKVGDTLSTVVNRGRSNFQINLTLKQSIS